jgi:hypothetical protein
MTKFVGTLNIPSLASAPGTAQEGDLYYNTSTDKVNFYNGAAWTEVGGGGGNTVYYQASAPGSANTGDIWIDSDSVLGGPLTLTDSTSSTSTTTAATPNSVKTAYDLAANAVANAALRSYLTGSSSLMSTVPRWAASSSTANSNNSIRLDLLIPTSSITVSNITMRSASLTAGATLIRFGIYTRSGSTFTLVARTASDTTIFAATNTRYTRALATAGGYPSTYSMTAGSEYWIGYIIVGATTLGSLTTTVSQSTWGGVLTYNDNGPTDLSATVNGSANARSIAYAEVS